MKALPDSAADLIARLLKRRGVTRVFALCGGHIMPIWMRLDAEGIRIVDVRDERAAVHMAQAHAELTGELGVALVTAGPGVTNAMTGIANAHVSRAPVLVLSGTTPRPQENRGGLQDMDHTQLRALASRAMPAPCASRRWCCRSSTRRSRAPSAKAASPVRPTSIFRPTRLRGDRAEGPAAAKSISRRSRAPITRPTRYAVARAVDLLWSAAPRAGHFRPRRPRRRTRADRAARPPRRRLPRHRRKPRAGAGQPSFCRGRHARCGDERCRRGAHGRPAPRLPARLRLACGISGRKVRPHRRYALGNARQPARRRRDLRVAWRDAAGDGRSGRKPRVRGRPGNGRAKLRGGHEERAGKLQQSMARRAKRQRRSAASEQGAAGAAARPSATTRDRHHRRRRLPRFRPRRPDRARPMLDPGPFGCIGIGVPYGIAASLAFPDTAGAW